ncbi:MAG: hypothetical protein HY084_12775 [Gemmatimonadetes bacterium]|nr:hypothetical protein [Gemmatimonadota bacterium]
MIRSAVAALLLRLLSAGRGFALALALSLALNVAVFGDIWWRPGRYLFGTGGDGLKNYYTTVYHAAHDSSVVWFRGMNHPDGDHVLFTDDQPALAEAFRVLVRHGALAPATIPGVMNWLMISSMVLGAGILWLVFAELAGPGDANGGLLLAAVLVGGLAPQYERLAGHYALAYAWVIPAALLLWLKLQRQPRAHRYLGLALYLTAVTFIHLYYGAILFLLLTSLAVASAWQERRRLGQAVATVCVAALPLLVMRLFLALTDPVRDRPEAPIGFLGYRAHWESLFLPLGHFPITFLSRVILIRPWEIESAVYIGLPATLFCAVVVWQGLAAITRGARAGVWLELDSNERSMAFAAIVAALFSLGVPFIFGLDWLLPYLGPIRQFRSLGRFAWAFYYLANILAFGWLMARCRAGTMRLRWPALALLVLAWQVYDYRAGTHARLANLSELGADGAPARLARSLHLSEAEYQAIWPVPYFHIGGERVKREPACDVLGSTLQLSWVTGIPTNGVAMSRTSYAQTVAKIAAHDDTAALAAFRAGLVDRRPFVVVRRTRDCPLSPSDRTVIAGSELLYAAIEGADARDSLLVYRFRP